MEYLSNLSFEYPYSFILLFIYLLCKLYCKSYAKEIYFSNSTLIKSITSKETSIKNILEFLFVFFLVLSLASIVSKNSITQTKASGYEMLIALDASESMRDDDRFSITKEIVKDFIQKRRGDRIALSLFAQDVYLAVPFTYDKKPLSDILEYIEVGVAGSIGTSLYDALYMSGNIFKNSHAKNKICILLTDGIDTKNNIALDIAIKNIKKYGVKVYVIGIGKDDEYNKNVLEDIAKQSGGKFFHTDDPHHLESIYKQIDSLEKSKIKTQKYTQIKYFYRYPLMITLVLLLVIALQYPQRKVLLFALFVSLLIALYKPSFSTDTEKKDSKVEFIVALDISKSMMAKDVTPSRFEFAKQKLIDFFSILSKEKVSFFAFSNQIYLIAPFTNNYEHLKIFVKNLHLQNINQNGTEYLKLLKNINNRSKKKALLLFTDGAEQKDFTKEIQFAKQNNMSIFIYLIGSKIGSVIDIDNKLVRDSKDKIVFSKVNDSIKQLATQTNGKLFYYSNDLDDLKEFRDILENDFNQLDGYEVKEKTEFFIYFIVAGFILFFIWRFKI